MGNNKDNKKDAFEGSSLGGLNHYIKRHQDAVRIEKAEAADKRIAEFLSRKHDLEWAKEALPFCDREEENGKDLIDISKGLQDIARIRQEAKDLLNAEEKRIQEEQNKLKQQQEEERIKLENEQERLRLLQEEERIKIENEQNKQKIEFENEQERLRLLQEEEKIKLENEQERLRLLQEEEKIKLENEQNKHNLEIAKEQENLNLQNQLNELRNKQQQDKLIESINLQIEEMTKIEKDRNWIEQIKNLNLKVKGLDNKLVEKVTNRFILDSLNNELSDVETALQLDDIIIELENAQIKNKVWADKVLKTHKKLDYKLDKYMKNKSIINNIIGEATKIYYNNDIETIELKLNKFEKSKPADIVSEYSTMKAFISKISKEILIGDYVDNFETRWKIIVKEMEEFIIQKAEKDYKQQQKHKKKQDSIKLKNQKRKKADAEKELKKQRNQKIKQKRRKKAKKVFNFIFVLLFNLIQVAVLAGLIYYGVVNFENNLGKAMFVIGVALTFILPNLRIMLGLRNNEGAWVFTFVPSIINVFLLAACIVSFVMKIFNFCALPLSAILLILSILHLCLVTTDNTNVDYVDEFLLLGILMIGAGIICTIISIPVLLAL